MRAALCLALLLALLGGSLGDVDGEAPRVASRSLLAGKAPPPKKTEASRVDKWRHAMGVLTRVKNKEIAQRTTANGDTKGTRDCYENDEHFSMALEGSWRTKTDDTSLWDGIQCEDYVQAHAFKAEPCKSMPQVLYRPDGCWLRDIVPVKFLSMIKGKTLWFWGDTVTKQQFTALRCQLSQRGRDGTFAARHLLQPGYTTACEPPHERGDCSPTVEVAPGDAHLGNLVTEAFPGGPAAKCLAKCDLYNLTAGGIARVCYVYADKTGLLEKRKLPCWAEVKQQDVVVANLGALFEGPEALGAAARGFAGFWARSMMHAPDRVPLLIWRETAATHFPGGKGDGNRNPESAVKQFLQKEKSCAADLDARSLEAGNWRNAVTNPLMEGLQAVPILRVFRPSARAAGAWHFGFEASGSDCVHWCQGHRSVPESWNTLLFNMLSEEAAMHGFRAKVKRGDFPHPPQPPPSPPPLPPPPPQAPNAPDQAVSVHAQNAQFTTVVPGAKDGKAGVAAAAAGAADDASAATGGPELTAAKQGGAYHVTGAAPGGGPKKSELQAARDGTVSWSQQASKGRAEAFAAVLKTGIPTEKHAASIPGVRNQAEIGDWFNGDAAAKQQQQTAAAAAAAAQRAPPAKKAAAAGPPPGKKAAPAVAAAAAGGAGAKAGAAGVGGSTGAAAAAAAKTAAPALSRAQQIAAERARDAGAGVAGIGPDAAAAEAAAAAAAAAAGRR